MDADVVSWSEELHRIYGVERDSFDGSFRAFMDRRHPDDRERVKDAVDKALAEGSSFDLYERIVHTSGQERILRSSGRVVRDDAGRAVRMFGTCQDVTEQRRAEEALQESEERLRLILQTAHEAFVSIDAKGLIIAWNPAAESIFGWSREEVLGRPLSETVIPARYRAAHQRGLERFLQTGEGSVLHKRIELEAVRRSGQEMPIEMTITPLQVGGRYVFNAFVRDISARRRSESFFAAQHAVTEVLAESSTLEEAVPRVLGTIARSMGWKVGGLWRVDPNSRALVCDAIWRDPSFGGERFEALSKEMSLPLGVGVPGRVWSTRNPVWVEDVTQDPNFPRAPAALQDGLHGAVGLPLLSGNEFLGAIEFFSEEIKSPEDDLIDMMLSISGQIGQFVKRKHAERESERLKDEFFAAVSHELRTPLTSIVGYTDLLLDGAAGELSEQQHNFLEVIARNGRRQLRLVGDLLFVSQVESNTFVIELGTVDLRALVAESVEAARPAANEKEIALSLVCDGGPTCPGDRDRLAQLVDNLVSNALKFTPAGGRAEVKLSPESDWVVIEVANTGSHIPPSDQQRLFERFFRASNATEAAVPGVGLGLTISKAIVTAHGGRIEVTSREETGTTFRVELPLKGTGRLSASDARSKEVAA
jgi:PAS domain S-box-containing protein